MMVELLHLLLVIGWILLKGSHDASVKAKRKPRVILRRKS